MNLEKRMQFFTAYLDKTGMDQKSYQFEGVKWCLENELREDPICGVRGGFIADEMGLGKTIMMIGLMLCNFLDRTLIVVPPMLVNQWVLQIYRTTGHKPLVYHGAANKKKITLEMLQKASCPIVITTYGAVAMRNRKKNKKQGTQGKEECEVFEGKEGKEGKSNTLSLLHQIEWSRIVYDEAHHLRNSNTALFCGVKMLKSKIHWLVSGTPIQNNIKDFYALCSVLRLPASFYTETSNLSTFVQFFLLKRTKKQVGIDMPPLCENVSMIDWKSMKEMEFSERIHNAISDTGQQKLVMMLLAKQTCIMNGLVTKHVQKLIQYGFVKNAEEALEACMSQSKLDGVIATILEKKGNGCGKLVFCHFREEIDEIAKRLRIGGIERVHIFDGRIPSPKKRQSIIEDAAEVILLQIQTGCEGLNLQQHYSEIYFVSPHFI
jgi:SNF2 family DNA or RNA helicase